MPQVGSLVVVGSRRANDMLSHDPDYSFVFAQPSEHKTYFKNPMMIKLDNTVGDLKAGIVDTQAHLVRELEEKVLDYELELTRMAHALGELDCTISLATVATQYDLVRPTMTHERVVYISNGRHPLQELTVDSFVPNDTCIGPDRKAAIVTGPNFSGKSVYLKQVGVIVFLAHVGAFVPASRAIIGLTDRIVTRVATLESCDTPQSSFQLDLNQMGAGLRGCTDRSLMLVDEFGKGTSAVDGMALLVAATNALLRRGVKLVLTTHFHDVLSTGLVDAPQCLYSMQMHHEGGGGDDDDEGALAAGGTPLFKLAVGAAKGSEGVACARQAGVPAAVLDRAEAVADPLLAGAPLPRRVDDQEVARRRHARAVALIDAFAAGGSWRTASLEGLKAAVAGL